jgi:hypothetical protein
MPEQHLAESSTPSIPRHSFRHVFQDREHKAEQLGDGNPRADLLSTSCDRVQVVRSELEPGPYLSLREVSLLKCWPELTGRDRQSGIVRLAAEA